MYPLHEGGETLLYRKLKADKSPINNQLYKMEELAGWKKDGGRVGWIISDGYIAVDVDDFKSSEIVMQMLDYTKVKYKCHSTPKGKHFIFKIGKYKGTQGSRFHTPVGLKVDTRLPNKGYIVLPINDPKRSVLIDTPFKDLDVAPFWLLPLKISITNEDFVSVGMTEGRNDALQRQIGRLKAAGLTSDQIKVIVILINQFVFGEPLPMTELEATVLRDENLKVEGEEKQNSLTHNRIAEMLMEMYDIRYIKESFYIYDNGYYQNGTNQLRLMMRQIYPCIKDQMIKEVFSYISDYTISSDKDIPEYFINLRNGNYSLKDERMYPHSPDIAGRNRIEFEYTTTKHIAAVDKFLLDIANGNPDRAKLILQMIGYSMTRTTREQVMFFLYGPSAKNGKSTLLDVMTALIGSSNVSVLSLKQLTQQFLTKNLDNKVANLCADISNKFLEDVAVLKQLSTGDTLTVDNKFKDSFDMKPFAKFIFSANELPKASKDKGWERRILIIPFERRFSAKDKDFNKEALLTPDALNYLGTKAIQAYQEIYNLPPALEGKWADSASSEECLDTYKEELDNAYSFYKTLDFKKMNCTVAEGQRLYLKTELFNEYKDFVHENGLKEKSKISFGKTIKEHLKDRVFNNKHYWVIGEVSND